jgi:hypothetical protein
MPIDASEFATNFPGMTIPPELEKLLVFEGESSDSYAECFELTVDDKGGLRSWSKNPEFLDRLFPFAQATGGGSFYALWAGDSAKSASEMPVVVFGDEGGAHVVARNLRELLQLLTFDVEPMVDLEGVTFYRDEDHDGSDRAEAYRAWLEAELGLEPLDDADTLVADAQAEHEGAFQEWMKRATAKK